MYSLVLLLIVSTVASVYIFKLSMDSGRDLIGLLSCTWMVINAIFCLIAIPFGILYHGSKYQSEIINREYGTNYTQEEVFYGSDVIDVIRKLDRKRLEVNGDVLRCVEMERTLRDIRKEN